MNQYQYLKGRHHNFSLLYRWPFGKDESGERKREREDTGEKKRERKEGRGENIVS